VGKPEGKRPLGRNRHRCEDNIKMDFHAVGWGAWTGQMWFDRNRWRTLVKAVIDFLVP
jgi:hypothetical protein